MTFETSSNTTWRRGRQYSAVAEINSTLPPFRFPSFVDVSSYSLSIRYKIRSPLIYEVLDAMPVLVEVLQGMPVTQEWYRGSRRIGPYSCWPSWLKGQISDPLYLSRLTVPGSYYSRSSLFQLSIFIASMTRTLPSRYRVAFNACYVVPVPEQAYLLIVNVQFPGLSYRRLLEIPGISLRPEYRDWHSLHALGGRKRFDSLVMR